MRVFLLVYKAWIKVNGHMTSINTSPFFLENTVGTERKHKQVLYLKTPQHLLNKSKMLVFSWTCYLWGIRRVFLFTELPYLGQHGHIYTVLLWFLGFFEEAVSTFITVQHFKSFAQCSRFLFHLLIQNIYVFYFMNHT